MIRLRGHHLICLNFFIGKGYSRRFVENVFKILKERWVKVVEGSDDVCRFCPYEKSGECRNPRTSDDEIRKIDEMALSLLYIEVNSTVRWSYIRKRLRKILPTWVRKVCRSCRWWKICKNEMSHQRF